jgi:ABC-type molybdate transport system ATPase subunit
MIRHHHEIVNLKLSRCHARTQHINEKPGKAIRLQQQASHACLRRHEECALVLWNRLEA